MSLVVILEVIPEVEKQKIYNATTNTFEPSTNSNFILSTPINNITQIKLASINIKKPYLISESKSNNIFIIKKYVKISESASPICDFSKSIIIEDIENLEYIPDLDDEVITPKIIISYISIVILKYVLLS